MKKLRIICGCEESQILTQAFRDLGHEAYSCDLIPTSGKHSEWHFQEDIFEVLKRENFDLGVFFPPCTYLTISANKWYKDQPARKSGALVGAERRQARELAVKFFMDLYNSDIPHIAIENPVGIMSTRFRKPDQVIQPWMFGHGETKATCLWLKNLPKLTPTNIVEGREQRMHKLPKTPDRAKLRSKTFAGVAKAIAEQYSSYLLSLEEK
jgi:hypothetical protein